MKKLGVSLVAVLVSLPMMAKAEAITPVTLLGSPAGTVATNTNVATTSYVKGAYNDLAGHINTNAGAINTLNGDVNTNGSVAKSISDALTTERSATQTLTNKTIDADDNTISDLEVDNFKSGVVATTVRAAGENGADDDHLVTESAVRTAVDNAITAATYDDTALSADVAANTSAINTLNGDANTSGSVANTVNAAITNLNLGTTYQAKTDSEVTSAEATAHSVLTAGTAVHTNLVNLATAVEGKQATIDSTHKLDSDLVDDTNATHKFVTASEKSQITTNANAIGNMSNLTGGESSLVEAVEAVRSSAATANGTKGFNVYGNWATPDTATGHVNVAAESDLQANPQP